MKLLAIAVAGLLSFSGACRAASPDYEGFVPLFNGHDLKGWRLRDQKQGGDRWKVGSDGVLINEWSHEHHGRDLLTERSYYNFILDFEYMMPERGNSGVYLRGRYEIQLKGDYSDRRLSAVANGAIYNRFSPSVYALKPSGEWQRMTITITGHEITVVLNGKTIQDAVYCEEPTHGALDDHINSPGPIMLQGTNGEVKFRKLFIKELPR